MKTTKKQLKEIQEIEKKVANVCDANDCVCNINDGVVDEITGLVYPNKLGAKLENEKFSEEEIQITLAFGYDAQSLKKQLNNQGFSAPKKLIVESELVRNQILSLSHIGILTKKATFKALASLREPISIAKTRNVSLKKVFNG